MKIEVELKKKYFFSLLAVLIILSGSLIVYAYNSSPVDPSKFGHSANEVEVTLANGLIVNLGDAIENNIIINNLSSISDGLGNIHCSEGQMLVFELGSWTCFDAPASTTQNVTIKKFAKVYDCSWASCDSGQFLVGYSLGSCKAQAKNTTSVQVLEGGHCSSDYCYNIQIACSNTNETIQQYTSGGLYGQCLASSAGIASSARFPASISANICNCPSGFSIIRTGDFGTSSRAYSCYKN